MYFERENIMKKMMLLVLPLIFLVSCKQNAEGQQFKTVTTTECTHSDGTKEKFTIDNDSGFINEGYTRIYIRIVNGKWEYKDYSRAWSCRRHVHVVVVPPINDER